jgi:hypothetical protein
MAHASSLNPIVSDEDKKCLATMAAGRCTTSPAASRGCCLGAGAATPGTPSSAA